MERGRGRGRGRSSRGGRRNAGNQDRSQNPWFSSGEAGNFRQPQNPGYPNPRANPPHNQGNPSGPRANSWQGPADGGRGSGGGRGGGHGGGRGRGRAVVAYVPRSPVPDPVPSPSSEHVVRELHQLKLAATIPRTPSEKPAREPMTRPDGGGNESMKEVQLLVNHFKVEFKSASTILHYHIDIQPEKVLKTNVVGRVSKSDALLLRNKLFAENLSMIELSKTAYDGEKTLCSAVELPTGKFTLTVSHGEDTRPRTYVISIDLVNKLEPRVLDEYLNGGRHSIPRDVLQAMDIVMQENPRRTQITMGRGFFSRSRSPGDDIGYGIIASKGFQQSLKPTSQGLSLCIDYTVMPFHKAVPVIQFLQEHFQFQFDKRMALEHNLVRDLERALKGLKVRVTHRNSLQKFTIQGLTKLNTNRITFDLEDPDNMNSKRKVTLVDYYMDKYNQEIQYQNLPCLDLSKGKRTSHVPMEFCILIEGQRYPKDDLPDDADKRLRNMSLLRPMERKNLICKAVGAHHGQCGGEIARQFGITVSTEMTRVMGRVLSPPTLKLRNANNEYSLLTPERNCQYNFNNHKVVDGKEITRWGILDFSQHWTTNERYARLEVDKFTRALIRRSRELGVRMENPMFYEKSSMDVLSEPEALSKLLERVYHGVAKGNLQILLCPMAKKHSGYSSLKRICETEIGIVTQCCLSFPANKCNDQYLVNILLKMNAKVGGKNMELHERLPKLGSHGHVMLIGADVNHPTDKSGLSPSVSAVVATMNWPAANRYAQRLRYQTLAEKIQNIGEMCSQLLEAYAGINGVKPESIVFFRDGVSESQFDMVLNEEFAEIRKAIESDGYKPKITLVIAQKRHLTRLFPVNERDGGKSGNIAPGTVVDETITHPTEFDFYLNSHHGSIGTSSPTHYLVLWDDHEFSSDQLQKLINNLCFTLPRCTMPISVATPVYYADLAAYRGRQYCKSLDDLCAPWSISSPPVIDHTKYPLVHSDLENLMICI